MRKIYPIDYVPEGSAFTFIKQTQKERTVNGKRTYSMALYRCRCGNERVYNTALIKQGSPKSCGCWRKNIDFVPNGSYLTFIKQTVFSKRESNKRRVFGKALYQCGCGNMKEILTYSVHAGLIKSCGCLIGKWTKQLDEKLIHYFPDLEKASKKIGKTISAINMRAKKLQLFHAPVMNVWYESIPKEARAYIAGHFDGEGCAYFRNKEKGCIRQPMLVMNIANKEAIIFYLKYFNGKCDEMKGKSKMYPHRKVLYRWRCTNYEDIYNFILSTIPYSIEKKEQLMCFKEYFEKYIENGKKTGYGKEFREFVNLLHIKCSQLKRA